MLALPVDEEFEVDALMKSPKGSLIGREAGAEVKAPNPSLPKPPPILTPIPVEPWPIRLILFPNALFGAPNDCVSIDRFSKPKASETGAGVEFARLRAAPANGSHSSSGPLEGAGADAALRGFDADEGEVASAEGFGDSTRALKLPTVGRNSFSVVKNRHLYLS